MSRELRSRYAAHRIATHSGDKPRSPAQRRDETSRIPCWCASLHYKLRHFMLLAALHIFRQPNENIDNVQSGDQDVYGLSGIHERLSPEAVASGTAAISSTPSQ